MARRLAGDHPVTTAGGTAARLRAVPLAFLVVFFAVPVVGAFVRFARAGAIVDALGDPVLRPVAWFTLWQAAVCTALTLAVAMPLTWALSRRSVPGARTVTGIVTAPFLMPAVVVATGVAAIVPSRGIPAVIVAHVVFNVAVVVRTVGPRWSLLPTALEDAAADLGAGPWPTFTGVVWPAIRGSVVAAASLVFVFCWSSYAVVSVLGGTSVRTLETEVFTRAVRLGDVRSAVAVSVVQAFVVVAVLVVGGRRMPDDGAVHGTSADRPRGSVAATCLAWVTAAAVVSPVVAVAIRSVRRAGSWSLAGWRALFDGSLERVGVDTVAVLATSLRFALVTSVLAVALALLAVSRPRPSIVERVSILPLVVSAVTLGLGIVITFDRAPVDWRARTWLLPVVHAVVALPLVVRVIGPAVRSVDPALLDTAADLGAAPVRVRTQVEFPLLRGAIARAAGIAAAVSVGEFGATSFLTRSGSTTVPIAIAQLMGRPGPLLQQAAFALATLTAVVCAALLARV